MKPADSTYASCPMWRSSRTSNCSMTGNAPSCSSIPACTSPRTTFTNTIGAFGRRWSVARTATLTAPGSSRRRKSSLASIAPSLERFLHQLDGPLAAGALLGSHTLNVANIAIVIEVLHHPAHNRAESLDFQGLRAGEQARFEFKFAGADAFVQPDGFGEMASKQRVAPSIAGLQSPDMLVVRGQ